jgi:hypothetical protein
MGSLIDALQGEPSICLDACTLISDVLEGP